MRTRGRAPRPVSPLSRLREDIAELSAILGAAESAATLPHREKYLLLVIGFLRRLLELHLELIDEVECELSPQEAAS
jgi:hypothetical protein